VPKEQPDWKLEFINGILLVFKCFNFVCIIDDVWSRPTMYVDFFGINAGCDGGWNVTAQKQGDSVTFHNTIVRSNPCNYGFASFSAIDLNSQLSVVTCNVASPATRRPCRVETGVVAMAPATSTTTFAKLALRTTMSPEKCCAVCFGDPACGKSLERPEKSLVSHMLLYSCVSIH
jgi:hypothetical protein